MARPYPYVPKDAGDIIRADDWNELQIRAQEEIQTHQHTGDSDGSLIPRTGIEPEAIDGSRIDPEAEVTLKTLTITEELKVNGQAILGEVDEWLDRIKGTLTSSLEVTGKAQLGSLSVSGKVGIGVAEPQAKLQIMDGAIMPAPGNTGDSGILFPTDSFGSGSDTAWIRHHNARGGAKGTLEIGIAPDGDDHIVLNPTGNVGIGTQEPQTKLEVAGVVRARTFESTNPLRHRMYPADPLVYQDIFEAKTKGAIAKLGNPQYDETTYSSTTKTWNGRRIIRFGSNNETDDNGARVTIPAGYDTVWIRVLGNSWNAVKTYFLDGAREDIGLWVGGFRGLNCYCPDGSLSDGNSEAAFHQWLPIPTRRAGLLALISKPNTNSDFWLSGLAFSKNPWAHATQSAITYHWVLNGGNNVNWYSDSSNHDVLGMIVQKTNCELKVPVIPSGRDKLLYLIEYNSVWNGCMHAGITVNNQPIERFTATYDNPFARHWNSKSYERYIAARIPANLIPADARWLSIRIDMSTQIDSIYFREIGTHDLDIPWG